MKVSIVRPQQVKCATLSLAQQILYDLDIDVYIK